MKMFKAPMEKVKKIFDNFKRCKRRLREAELKLEFLNNQIKEYNGDRF